MLKVYRKSDPAGTVIEVGNLTELPADFIWVDLFNPTHAEEQLVERTVNLSIPTREEMAEIEASSRLYEENGAVYLTASVLAGLDKNSPESTPVSFVLTQEYLITVRYADPKPFRTFADLIARQPELLNGAVGTLVRLLDVIVDRLADALEHVASEIDNISKHIFRRSPEERGRRIPAIKLEALLMRIGNTQDMLAKARETARSTTRLLAFLPASSHFKADTEQREHLRSLRDDVDSLTDHSNFQSSSVIFLLDASLGLINIEQSAILKIFSVASVMLLPPTLVGSVYGMNFDHMPELTWAFGYPMALMFMVMSAVLPYLFFRRKGWL